MKDLFDLYFELQNDFINFIVPELESPTLTNEIELPYELFKELNNKYIQTEPPSQLSINEIEIVLPKSETKLINKYIQTEPSLPSHIKTQAETKILLIDIETELESNNSQEWEIIS